MGQNSFIGLEENYKVIGCHVLRILQHLLMDLLSFVGPTWRTAYHYRFFFNKVKQFRVFQTNYLIAVYSLGDKVNADHYVLFKGKFSF